MGKKVNLLCGTGTHQDGKTQRGKREVMYYFANPHEDMKYGQPQYTTDQLKNPNLVHKEHYYLMAPNPEQEDPATNHRELAPHLQGGILARGVPDSRPKRKR